MNGDRPPREDSGRPRRWRAYLLGAYGVLLVAWWTFGFVVAPRLIAAAYRGDTIELFNRMISGSGAHDLAFYLEAWSGIRDTGTLLTFVLLALVLAVSIFLPVARGSPAIPGAVAILFLIDVALSLAYLANYVVGEPSHKLTELLDVAGERSIAAWFSSIQFFCVALLGGLFLARGVSWKDKVSWPLVGLPLLFLLLSLDEAVMIHEWLGDRTDWLLPSGDRKATPFRYTGIWMFVIGIPFLMLFFSWTYFIARCLAVPRSFIRKLVAGMMVLAFGAFGVEALGNLFEYGSSGYTLSAFFEETLEMMGATVILWAVYDLVADDIDRALGRGAEG